MARSYGINSTSAVGSASYHQLAIYMATAAGVRPKVFEFMIGASATPADQASRYNLVRSTTGAPTGGSSPTIATADPADPASLATSYTSATGGETMSTICMILSVNQRASFRWVAAPTKEWVVANTQFYGLGLQVAAQTASYNVDLTLLWEE